MSREKSEISGVPKNVMMQGRPVAVEATGTQKKPVIKTNPSDPREPIKKSPFTELLNADDEWIKKYGGSDISILAYNINQIQKILTEKTEDVEVKDNKQKGTGETQSK